MSDFRCNEYSAPMDSYKHHIPKADSYLYSSDELQPGLEVGNAPSRQPCPWPRQEIDGVERKQTAIPERKQIAGLAIGTFWALVVSLSVIVAGVIGGGVGAGLAAQKNKCKSSVVSGSGAVISAIAAYSTITQIMTTTSTINSIVPTTISASDSVSSASATSSVSSNPSVSPAPSSHCADSFSTFNNSLYQPLSSLGSPISLSGTAQTFLIACYTNYPSGASYGNPDIHDIMKIYMPDFNQCIMACAEYNAGYATNLQDGVDVGGGLCRAVSMVVESGEFCYLKNGTGVNNTVMSGGTGVRKDSAILQ